MQWQQKRQIIKNGLCPDRRIPGGQQDDDTKLQATKILLPGQSVRPRPVALAE